MDTTRIRLVPSKTLWAFIFLLLFCTAAVAALMLLVPDCGCSTAHKTNPVPGLLAGLCLPALLIAWSRFAYREADQDGLHWRTFFKVRFAPWADVEDYYLTTLSGDSKVARRGVVKTTHGDFTIDPDWFGNVEGLRAMVQERAVNARARSWERHGMRRDIDWPQDHGYDKTGNQVMGVVMPLLSVACVVLWSWMIWPKIPRSFDEPGIGWTIVMLLIASVPAFVVGTVPGFYIWRLTRESIARGQDKVFVSREGISLLQPGKTTRIGWNDVERFYIDSTNTRSVRGWPPYVVESGNERIDFVQSIRNFAVLTDVIAREAVAAHQDGWLNNAALRENLDRCASERTVDAIGRTRRLFHYRTRSIRRAIFYGVAVGATLTLIPLIGRLGAIDKLTFPDLDFVIFPVILLWTIWRYRTAGILTTSSGITQYALFGNRTLSWESIVRCRIICEDWVPITILTDKSGTQIRFFQSICDVAELKREIRRRAPQTDFDRREEKDASCR